MLGEANLHSDVLCESQSSPKVVLPRQFVGSIAQTKLDSFVECGADAHGWHEFLVPGSSWQFLLE